MSDCTTNTFAGLIGEGWSFPDEPYHKDGCVYVVGRAPSSPPPPLLPKYEGEAGPIKGDRYIGEYCDDVTMKRENEFQRKRFQTVAHWKKAVAQFYADTTKPISCFPAYHDTIVEKTNEEPIFFSKPFIKQLYDQLEEERLRRIQDVDPNYWDQFEGIYRGDGTD